MWCCAQDWRFLVSDKLGISSLIAITKRTNCRLTLVCNDIMNHETLVLVQGMSVLLQDLACKDVMRVVLLHIPMVAPGIVLRLACLL
jgi:hypothetical protein